MRAHKCVKFIKWVFKHHARDVGSIPALEIAPGEGNGDPLQYSWLGDPIDRGAWWAPWGHKESGTIEGTHTHIHVLAYPEEIRLTSIAAAAAESFQSCPTLCDPIDSSPSGSAIPGILQARTLEWIAISFSKAWEWKVNAKPLSRVWLSATPWTAAHQAPLPMGFPKQEYWSGVPLPLAWTN